jgi:hypothetical protein
MATERVRPLRGSSFYSFEDAVLQAGAASPTPERGPQRFDVLHLSVEIGGFVGRPQFIADVALEAGPNV